MKGRKNLIMERSRLPAMHATGEELCKRLRLRDYPIAVKMLKRISEIPSGAVHPFKDLGQHLAQCQAYAMSRREGETVAMLLEDEWCPEAIVGYGLAKTPVFFDDGSFRYPGYCSSRKAGLAWARGFPRLEYGKYIGVVSSPLTSTLFVPDLVIIYCNPAQLTMLLTGIFWKTGQDLKCTISATAVCTYGVVLPLQTGSYQISSPCFGDRTRAGTQDDQMVFTIPEDKLDIVLAGLRHGDKDRKFPGLPVKYSMKPDYQRPDAYNKLSEILTANSKSKHKRNFKK